MKDARKAIIQLTKLMDAKSKFAFLNISHSSIIGLNKKGEKSFPQDFSQEIINSINISGPKIMKNISFSLAKEINEDKHSSIGLKKGQSYFIPNLFEYYYSNDKEIFRYFVDFYIKNTPKVIVTFHDYKKVSAVFGVNAKIINVAYDSCYKKMKDIYEEISKLDGKIDYCLLDCSALGLALSGKIWDNLNMSVIDLGKTLILNKESGAKNNETHREKKA